MVTLLAKGKVEELVTIMKNYVLIICISSHNRLDYVEICFFFRLDKDSREKFFFPVNISFFFLLINQIIFKLV
jgi:hypothetical protein